MFLISIIICLLQFIILINCDDENINFLLNYIKYSRECNREFNVELLQPLSFDGEKLICYQRCILEKMSIITTTNIESFNITKALNLFNPINDNNINVKIKECFNVKKNKNVCEKATNILQCLCEIGVSI